MLHAFSFIKNIFCLILLVGFVVGCSTMSNLPTTDNVKISREDAGKDCKFIGKLEGRTISKNAKSDEALKDLQKEAANRGANYLVVKEYSSLGGAVTGLAYKCE